MKTSNRLRGIRFNRNQALRRRAHFPFGCNVRIRSSLLTSPRKAPSEVNMAPRTVNKSAKTGKFVTKAALKKRPATTFRETTKPRAKAKPKKK
jgi:hypothetical protein